MNIFPEIEIHLTFPYNFNIIFNNCQEFFKKTYQHGSNKI